MGSQKIFAIGDIHGCAQELSELISKLPLSDDSKIVFLGDYIDRGPDSKGVIQQIIDLSHQYEVVALKGNHEDMMLEFFKDPSSSMAGFFILNGGSATLASYIYQENQYQIPDEHMNFLRNLSYYHETEEYFFVHAGVPNIKIDQIEIEKHKHELLWIREGFLRSRFNWRKKIIHGHSPKPEPEIKSNRINLDTGCVFNGHLTAIELPSETLYQVPAREKIPHTFLKENPQRSRVAKRFLGEIPVFVETEEGYDEFTTINYNEFGLLIVDLKGGAPLFEVGQIIKGKIGSLSSVQIEFTGQVVRNQKHRNQMSYGIKMLDPLSKKSI